MEEGGVKLDKWGYEVRTSSRDCISAINSFYHQVVSYGRERSVILEAPLMTIAACWPTSWQPIFFTHSIRHELEAAKSHLEQATLYEKLVFEAVSYLVSEDTDDDVAVDLHLKKVEHLPGKFELLSFKFKRAIKQFGSFSGRFMADLSGTSSSGQDSQYTRKKGRHGTRLKELTRNRVGDQKIPIEFDNLGRAQGPNKKKFRSYVALLGRSKASILINEWDDVPERVKEQIWQSITLTYDVPQQCCIEKEVDIICWGPVERVQDPAH